MFNLSPEQTAYLNWIDNGRGSLVLEAVAGAGKSSTLIQGLGRMRGDVALCAFNKKIAEELIEKAEKSGVMRRGIRIQTMHGVGFSALRYENRNLRVDEKKAERILEAELESQDFPVIPFATRLISHAKQRLLLPGGNKAEYMDIINHFGLDEFLPNTMRVDAAIEIAMETLHQDRAMSDHTIDFDDMVYLPALGRGNVWRNDWVLIDEAQDTNLARRKLARRMLKPSGRLVAVGDRHQAIYAFTGADTGALDRIKQDFNCEELPLSVSWRCPVKVVEEARKLVPHINPSPSASEGKVTTLALTAEKFIQERCPTADSAILCRYNRPLVAMAFSLIRAGVCCKMEGRDIGRSLVALVDKWKTATTLDQIEARLNTWLEKERRAAEEKKNPRRAQMAEDRVGTILVFIENLRDQEKTQTIDLRNAILSLFADNVSGMLTLSSIHKSKGREWPSVYWIQAEGGRQARKDWEEETERCCQYVAITRAQEELVYLNLVD